MPPQYLITASSYVSSSLSPTYAKKLEKWHQKTHTLLLELDEESAVDVMHSALSLLDRQVDRYCEYIPDRLKWSDVVSAINLTYNSDRKRKTPLRNNIYGDFKRSSRDDRRQHKAVVFSVGTIIALPEQGVYELGTDNVDLINDLPQYRNFPHVIHLKDMVYDDYEGYSEHLKVRTEAI